MKSKIPETEVKDGKLVRKRGPSNYESIWKTFKEKYDEEFREYMGFGSEEIEKIGLEKFIDMMDWYFEEEIGTFKNDIIHVVICDECNEKFIYFPSETEFLCEKCTEKYDMDQFVENLKNLTDEGKRESMLLFSFEKTYREMFSKKEDDKDAQV